MTPAWQVDADLVVVGSGVAGLTAAVHASRRGLRVVVVTKGAPDEANTSLAQGGVAVVLPEGHEPGDTVERHAADTLTAGGDLCDPEAVATVVGTGPAAVDRLRSAGAAFDVDPAGELARTREGGHSAFRVIHAGGDATGAEVERALLADARGTGVPLLDHHVAVDVLCSERGVGGLVVADSDGVRGTMRTPAVLLASGGLGQLYHATSNPEVATGDGLALALRAGAEVADTEFVQFHPTVLYADGGGSGRRPLVTEAVRGEGAVLVDAAGERVMTGVHPLGDLAPRDVVSAAITARLTEAPGGVDDHVYLDATHLDRATFQSRFPTVFAACRGVGVDPSVEPIPVAPAAHFACGGVVATVDGRTSVPGLYAAGEVARTGLHGANRLASNSLLEGLVVGERTADAVAADLAAGGPAARWRCERARPRPELVAPALERTALQRAMSRHAAIGRDEAGLARVAGLVSSAPVRQLDSRQALEDAALTLAARALVLAARTREESRGCHVRRDRPRRDDARWRHSIAVRLDDRGEVVLAEPVALEGAA